MTGAMRRRQGAAHRPRPLPSLVLASVLAVALGGCADLPPAPPPPTEGSPVSAAPNFRLDPTHTFVHWEVVHMGTSTIRGRFDRSAGRVHFDPKAKRIALDIDIDTASASSGVPTLDKVLRGSALLDVAAHPQAHFRADAARWEGEIPREIVGEFTLRGVRQPLTLRALRWNCSLNLLFRREVCGGDFEARIDRSRFGITHSLPFVADQVRLLIQVEAIAQ